MTEERAEYRWNEIEAQASAAATLLKIFPPIEDIEDMDVDAFRVIDALRARVAELEAKAAIVDSVPWEAIEYIRQWAEDEQADSTKLNRFVSVVHDWYRTHAPQE